MAEDILTKIVAHKNAEIRAARQQTPVSDLEAAARARSDFRSFRAAMKNPGQVNIIAEIKRASPSKGDICPGLDPARHAAAYERGGAVALSVLTDATFFKGSLDDMEAARRATGLPVLRKDFIVSDYQVYEAAARGADAVLLIVRILSESRLAELLDLCADLDIDALVEVHTPADLEIAAGTGAVLIGINNRNLASFDTDIQNAMDLAASMGPHQIPIAASGIASRADIEQNLAAGIRNFLVGESLVRAQDPETFLTHLKNG
ncbi:MAG: indole-3-glycerol phosphate synthase TrpC [Desulfobacterales bacterium]|nr:indole-3-glycerol phosphate synthase TrpC [Desulfobacterales bacterium]